MRQKVLRGRRGPAKHVLPLVVVFIGVFFVIGSIGGGFYLRTLENPGVAPLPGRIAGLDLAEAVYGREAAENIYKMHGQGFALSSAAVGIYGSKREIQLWVSGAAMKWIAGRLVRDMEEKIAESDTPFVPIGKRDVEGRSVFELEGLGQRHFYFRSGRLLVWMAVEQSLAEQALSECLKRYPKN